MQITLPTREVRDALSGISKLISARTTLPVLHAVRFSNSPDGQVTAQATDLDSTVTFSFTDASGSEAGAFVLDLDHLRSLSRCSGDAVRFEADSPDRVTVTTQAGGQPLRRTLPAIDPQEWPEGLAQHVAMQPAPGFLETFRMLEPFTSRDQTRYVLQGVHLDVGDREPDGSVMVATDGRRLASRNHMTLPLAESCILRSSKFLTWSRLPADADVGMAKGKSGSTISVRTGPWAFTTKAIEGTFPNWRQVVPTQTLRNRIEITESDEQMLLRALPSLPDCQYITLVGHGGKVSVWARAAEDPDWTRLTLPQSTHEGADIAYSVLDRIFVREALEAGLFRSLSFEDELSPVLSRNDTGGTHVLMPMRASAPQEIAEAIEAMQAGEAKARAEDMPQESLDHKIAEPVHTPEPPQPTTTTQAAVTPVEVPVPAPEYKKKGQDMNTEKTTPVTVQPATSTSALDRALDAFEQAKAAVREAATQLATLASELRTAVRDQKSQAADLDKARGTLAKLQSISL